MNVASHEPLTNEAPRDESRVPTGAWVSHSEEETFALGRRIGEGLRGGEVLLLGGPLGAGKTVFVKGVAAAAGFDVDEVTSPSFTLVNRYDGERLTVYHLDLYRLADGASAAHAVDLEELLADESAVILIEWAERLGRYPLPPTAWRVRLEGDGEAPRRVTVERA